MKKKKTTGEGFEEERWEDITCLSEAKTLGERLGGIVDEFRYGQRDYVAKSLGITLKELASIEEDKKMPSETLLILIEHVMGVKKEFLLEGKTDNKNKLAYSDCYIDVHEDIIIDYLRRHPKEGEELFDKIIGCRRPGSCKSRHSC